MKINISKKISSNIKKFESRSMQGQLPIVWKKAENFTIEDFYNKKYIDFTSTIFVSNIGHSNRKLISSLKKTLNKKLLHSYAYFHELRSIYLKKLVKFAGKGFDKAFLMSSGTEATEAALKLMRLNGIKNKKKKLGIICFEGNWHGRTMGAQLMSGNDQQKKWIGFKDPNIYHLPLPYPWKVKNDYKKFFYDSIKKIKRKINIKKDICGVMVETFQGWGCIFYPKEYIVELRKFCDKNNLLLSFDEMQAGFSRTGKNFGFQHYGVKADLICCGKGMGGGVAISGVIGKKKIMDLPEIGNMSSTNSANPLACAAGIAVIDEIQNRKLNLKTTSLGKILSKHLKDISKKHGNLISYVFSKGLVGAIIFNKNIKNVNGLVKNITLTCLKDGLLVVFTGRESIKIGPPLTINKKALIKGLKILDYAIIKETKKI